MKIKQSFIDRCGEITVKQVKEIATESNKGPLYTISVLIDPDIYKYNPRTIQATANVLKIDLSDIYEVEQLPNTLTE